MTIQKAASAGVWSAIDIGLRQGFQFVVSIALARMLMPTDFGIVAIIMFFSSLFSVFIQGGLMTALVQRQQTNIYEESAAFWLNLLASGISALILVAIAPAIANFYDHPVLQPLIMVSAAQVVFSALGSVQAALLTRELKFAQLTKAGVLASLVSGILGVAAASAGAGVWSLVIQLTSAAALNNGALWLLSGWRPVFHFKIDTIKSFYRFGAWLSLSALLEVIYSQGFALLVGKLHGVRELGYYNRASGAQLLPSNILSSVISRVALPLFSSRSSDREAMRRGMRMAISLAMLLNLPAMLGIVILSDTIIETLFGAKWLPAAPILSVLAISGILLPMHAINLNVLLAQGRPNVFFKLEIAKKSIGIGCVAVGSFYGVFGLAWSQVIVSVISFGFNSLPTKGSLGYGPLSQIRDLGGVILATAAMSAVIFYLSRLLALPATAELAILVSAGVATYLVAGFGLRMRSFVEAYDMVRMLIDKRGSST